MQIATPTVRERPILFQGAMVRALLAGTKTQTRRLVKPQDMVREGSEGIELWTGFMGWQLAAAVRDDLGLSTNPANFCPYGEAGDKLWVREAFMHEPADYCWEASVSIPSRPASTVYRADFPGSKPGEGWKPSIHMPRSLCRIELEVTDVRIERLQTISEADAVAEGALEWSRDALPGDGQSLPAVDRFAFLWNSINGDTPLEWKANPWVWIVGFRRLKP